MKQYLTAIKVGLALALVVGAFSYGYHKGVVSQLEQNEADRLRVQNELFDVANELYNRTQELETIKAEKGDLIYELERQALEAVGSSNNGVASTGGLQRLEQRWGSSPRSP